MKNEPLRGKKPKDEPFLDEFEKGCIQGYEDCLDDVKSAVEFWYEYRDKPLKFRCSFKKDFENFLIVELGYEQCSDEIIYLDEYYINIKCKEEFNKWLFKYTFADVI